MCIKVIINNGVVTEVLSDGQADIEIISIDKDYADYEKLRTYERELHEVNSLKRIDFSVANFEDD